PPGPVGAIAPRPPTAGASVGLLPPGSTSPSGVVGAGRAVGRSIVTVVGGGHRRLGLGRLLAGPPPRSAARRPLAATLGLRARLDRTHPGPHAHLFAEPAEEPWLGLLED